MDPQATDKWFTKYKQILILLPCIGVNRFATKFTYSPTFLCSPYSTYFGE